ncbi:MAG: hypothetical protein HQL69_20755 [Magnetococcales bacterium]|nr:hypothetical protein [Magnetococcales bacterium]
MDKSTLVNFFKNLAYWIPTNESVSKRLLAWLPIQTYHNFSDSFGDIFEKDLPRVREEWKGQFSFIGLLRKSRIGHLITAVIIWPIAIPLVLLDLMATLYQTVCFPIFDIPTINRSDFIIIDRHKLSYLNWLEKINCVYCGYGNGVLAYATEIASLTEKRWCPIKHQKIPKNSHSRYADFSDYGDSDNHRVKKNERKKREGKR